VHLIGSSVIRRGLPLKKAMELLESNGTSQCKAERVRLADSGELALTGDEHDAYITDIKTLIDHDVERLASGQSRWISGFPRRSSNRSPARGATSSARRRPHVRRLVDRRGVPVRAPRRSCAVAAGDAQACRP
jgi:hypothetical protein